eukprot:TRINITY_DN51260_c0_g1_i2.p1 TRINITY_DN51260_c0_g1~~TRINITY_DN51260_c0_g1_i2.p1  ORF type:complete len:585 (-),score=151.12 TRINITY_DN51260_c0_g1_i2:6-1760(-)
MCIRDRIFTALFVDFIFFGGRCAGALAGEDLRSKQLIKALCTQYCQSGTVHSTPAEPYRQFELERHTSDLFVKVQLEPSAKKRATALLTLYLHPRVLNSPQHCHLPVLLLREMFQHQPAVLHWAQFCEQQTETFQKGSSGVESIMAAVQCANLGGVSSTPVGLACELYPFQQETLFWMLHRERGMHSLSQLLWMELVKVSGERVLYSPLLSRWQEASSVILEGARGGLLCEEIGLGKTVESLAIILANPFDSSAVSTSKPAVKGTIVVCPVSVVGQWRAEVREKAPALTCCVYHGQHRVRDLSKLSSFDIVLTTYSTLASEWKRSGENLQDCAQFPLAQLHWHRVLLDESHHIKSKSTGHSRACCAIHSTYRWCVSGTPIEGSVRDLEGQLAFLRVPPFDTDSSVFRAHFQQHLEKLVKAASEPHSFTVQALWVLKQCMVRHTKRDTVSLPPRSNRKWALELSPADRALYNTVARQQLYRFNELLREAGGDTNKAAFKFHLVMLPLRQLCAGGNFRYNAVSEQAHGMLQCVDPPEEDNECPICQDAFLEPVRTPCKHWFCRECILHYFGVLSAELKPCPCCRQQ